MSARLCVVAATLAALGLAGCGGSGSPQQLSKEEAEQKMKEQQRVYQEKMGGGKPGMTPEDMKKMAEKFKPADK